MALPRSRRWPAPFGGVRFVPTGGVGPKNLGEYLAIPAVAAVGGSWMVPRDRVKAGDFAGITALTADAVALAVARPADPTHDRCRPADQSKEFDDG